MNLNAIQKRIDNLQNHGRKKAGSIIISSIVGTNNWTVIQDHNSFDSLQAAINHIKQKYTSKTIKVDQVRYQMSKMTDAELRKIAKGNQLATDDPAFDVLKQPSDVLAKAIKDNPDLKFEVLIMTEKQQQELQ